MPFVLSLAWRDLRGSGRSLWIFCACLVLGVTLIAGSGGLFRQVSGGLLSDTRALLGGDLEVRDRAPLRAEELAWMRSRGDVSLLVEMRTMLRAADGPAQIAELQSFGERYPLYGNVELRPASSLGEALAMREGRWGAAVDPVLAERLGVAVGDRIEIGDLPVTVRALIARQPDRSLRADWRGPPVLIAAEALEATGLVQPGSRLSYRYRIRTSEEPGAWRTAFSTAFPDAGWEVHTFMERGDQLAEVLGQIASGLLLIGFSALFVGGLGVFNSVHAYLQAKLATIVKAGAGLAVIAGVSLLASLLVLVSAIASSRARQIYDASVLHVVGARISMIRRSLQLEYTLLAVLTSLFAIAVGSVIAIALLQYRLQLESQNIWWMGVVTAVVVSASSLGLSARHLLRRLGTSSAQLRAGG